MVYGRYRYGSDWYRGFFFFLAGLLVGQLVRIDLGFSIHQNDPNRIENVRKYER